ncbi:MAG: valine--tRNA ligase [Bacilli bacterium]
MLDKRYDPKLVEQGKYDKWKKEGYFTAGDITKKPFSMVIPPPNVTGKLHIGHAWNTTIQDIIARYKRMKGYDVLWLPGMDHAGIATQAKVMEKLRNSGVDVTKITREEFLKKAWEWKQEYADSIHDQWAKMGLSLDYSRERFTLDEGLNKAVRKVFVDLYNKGLIYQGEKIINWDPVQKTALSNVEVIHEDDKGYMYYFKYPVVDSDEYLIVATTRPETMFGDVCVVVNPNDERYQKFVGKYVINPANGDKLVVIADEYVELDFGTGAMKCTPAHDPNDFIIGEKYHFPKPIIMNKDATMNEKCGKYEGMDRFVCREQLIKDIEEQGNFIKKEEIVHPVGHSERSHAIVEPVLSKQWFVKMRPLADEALKNQKGKGKVNFVPKRFEKVFTQWMNNVEDWCISRQLWWGHRIPAYYNKQTGEVLVSEEPPIDIENYEQENDVLDTWFSSGLWPFSTLGWPNETEDLNRYFPTSCLVTAYDIIFFWVSRMIFQSLNATNKRPFNDVLIHGLVRDELGRKMSKTLGNGVDPLLVIDKYGADALRYFLTTNSTPGQDMRYIEEKVQSSMNYLNKIWNSTRYVLSVLDEGFTPKDITKCVLSPLDKWIVNKMQIAIKNITKNMDKYDFNAASQHLYNFVYDDFCSSYLEMSKVSLSSDNEEIIIGTKNTLYYCIKNIILLIYPYTPFIAEEMYLSLPNHMNSVMEESYPKVNKKLIDNSYDAQVDCLLNMIKDVRNYKIVNKLAPNSSLPLSIKFKEKPFDGYMSYLERFTFAKAIQVVDKFTLSGETFIYQNGELLIGSLLSKDEQKQKLIKDIDFEENEINRSERMLNNPGFVAKAPKEKIELERTKLEKHKENLSLLLEKLNNL